MLEHHDLAVDMLRVLNKRLQAKGLMLRGTVLDAITISVPHDEEPRRRARPQDEADYEGSSKIRYRGLSKNTAQVVPLFALSNLWMGRRLLLA